MSKILEAAVDSLASARAAIVGGADRLELCSALAMGGLTPYAELLQQIRRESTISIRCLMRPRGGDFLYTDEEIALMAAQMDNLRKHGADGFAIGCLNAEGELDAGAMAPLLKAAKGMGLTLHRCIDVSRDPPETYLQAKELGFDTVLTSGAAASCTDGMATLRKLLALRDQMDGPEVLVGAGVSPSNIREIRTSLPGVRAFHASCKTLIESSMIFRRKDVPMGLPGFDEWHIQQTDETLVRLLNNELNR